MSRTGRVALVAALIAIIGPRATHAVEDPQEILGSLFLVKDPRPGVDASRRVVKIIGRQLPPRDPSDHLVGCGDPTADGATIEVIANGTNSSDAVYSMPASGWTRIPANVTKPVIAYKYQFGPFSPVRYAIIKRGPFGGFLLKVILLGKYGPISNVPPTPGTSGGGIFTIGGGGCTYCVTLGGAAGGEVSNLPPTTQDKVFKAFSLVTVPTVEVPCLTPTPTTTVTTTTSTTTTTLGSPSGAFLAPPRAPLD
jgi:hypothetical protein